MSVSGMRVTVFGGGYVGLVTSVCLAHVGHQVSCIDHDALKINALRRGIAPIFEPGLEDYLVVMKMVRRIPDMSCQWQTPLASICRTLP